MMQMITGFWTSCCIYTAAKLNIADHLAGKPLTASQLAETTHSHSSSLYRVLRALSGVGIFNENENGTFSNNSDFAPTIGMSRDGLLSDRAKRRRQHLVPELRMAKLEDVNATGRTYIGADWVTSDITLTTDAGQTPIAPGDRVSDVTRNGRRTAQSLQALDRRQQVRIILTCNIIQLRGGVVEAELRKLPGHLHES